MADPSWTTHRPDRVRIVEVGPRDGLQNEAAVVPAEAKVAFVEALADSGLPVVEVTSFVSPRAVPQLADADEVLPRVRRRGGVRYPVLVPNMRGMERAGARRRGRGCGVHGRIGGPSTSGTSA